LSQASCEDDCVSCSYIVNELSKYPLHMCFHENSSVFLKTFCTLTCIDSRCLRCRSSCQEGSVREGCVHLLICTDAFCPKEVTLKFDTEVVTEERYREASFPYLSPLRLFVFPATVKMRKVFKRQKQFPHNNIHKGLQVEFGIDGRNLQYIFFTNGVSKQSISRK
jgi:hypothetical protein